VITRAPAVNTVGRALQILDDLSRRQAPTSLSAIARRTGLPKSTVHRLLGILEVHRAVERNGDLYRLGALSLGLADGGDARHERLRRAVMPYLVDLFAQVQHSVSLAILVDFTVVYLETLYGPGHSPVVLRTDTSAPAHATAAGKLLLAYSPPPEGGRGVEVNLYPMTENTITTSDRFAAELDQIRREGVAYNREEYVPGLVGAASPIIVAEGRPLAAITVLGAAGEFDFATIVAKLRRSVHAASLAVRRHRSDPLLRGPHSDPR
jgi:DNA-binding IclR family transcriptional regulator